MANLLTLVKKISNLRHLRVKASIFVENKEVTNVLSASRHFGAAWCLLKNFNVTAFNSLDRKLNIKINGKAITIKIDKYNYTYEFSLSYDATGSLEVMINNNKLNKTPDVIAKEIVEWAVHLANMLLERSGERPINFKLSDAVCANKEIMAYWKQLRKYHVSYLYPTNIKNGSYSYSSTIVIDGQRHYINSKEKNSPENNANSPCLYNLAVFEDVPVIYAALESTSSLDIMLSTIKDDLSSMLDKANDINKNW